MSSDDELTATKSTDEVVYLATQLHQKASKRGPVVIAINNRKGGVGKTSLTCNLGDGFARLGLLTLVVGMDQQTSMQRDLGVLETDDGWGIVQTCLGQGEPGITKGVRPNLDALFGGPNLKLLEGMTGQTEAALFKGKRAVDAFRERIPAHFKGYDVVLIDFPPGNEVAQAMGMSITDWVIAPTRSDYASLEGLEDLIALLEAMHREDASTKARLLGCVLFSHTQRATAVRRTWERDVHDIDPTVHLFQTSIRHSERAAQDSRRMSLLARELADEAASAQGRRLGALSAGEEPGESFSSATSPLAADYQALAAEVLALIAAKTK